MIVLIRDAMYLHSTMFLLNPNAQTPDGCQCPYLHSTMFLLNPLSPLVLSDQTMYLHSTMFLLNLMSTVGGVLRCVAFTFHYVSIKSKHVFFQTIHAKDLHSTMFLLNPFTFSAVSCSSRIYIPLCFY